jgi:hypothetical protein
VSEVITSFIVKFGLLTIVLFFFITYLQDMRLNTMLLVGRNVSWKEFLFNREIIKQHKKQYREQQRRETLEKERRREEWKRQAPARAAAKAAALEKAEAAKAAAQQKANTVKAAAQQKVEADRQRQENADRQVEAEAVRVRRAKEEEKKVATDTLTLQLASLKSKLPFYISKKPPSAELADQDERSWKDVTRLVQSKDSKKATLYFVKIRSHLDDIEYHKIGMTTKSVEARFETSTQLELLDIVCVFKTELWKVAYLEYYFLREFRLYDGLASSLDESRPAVRFSGDTELVRSNSVVMISEFFGKLDVYNEL